MADEAWTLLDQIKTVAKATKDFREVRIEAGKEEDVAAAKYPALVIRLKTLDEEADEDTQQIVNFDLVLLFKRRGEEARVEEAIKISNDLKNALEGDATVRSYIADFPSMEPGDAESPIERWDMNGCTGLIYTTRTGR